jgi:hypothetical protein
MTDWIEGRSHKVLATVAIIDALDYSDEDLAELTKYLAMRCGFDHLTDEINIHDLDSLNDFYIDGDPNDGELLIQTKLEPSNDFAGLLDDRTESDRTESERDESDRYGHQIDDIL